MTEHEKTANDYREQRSRILHGLADRFRPSHLIWADLPAYESPIDGRIIEGRVQRREDLKRNGCREYDPGMIYLSANKVITARLPLRHLKIFGTGQVDDE